jgi:hypothetical protein
MDDTSQLQFSARECRRRALAIRCDDLLKHVAKAP